MIQVIGTYSFNIIGDGVATEILIPLRGLIAPAPIQSDRIPNAFLDIEIGKPPGPPGIGASVELKDGEFMHIVFTQPPSATAPTGVTVDALFGVDRIQAPPPP
jgi:hypothetical protein